jgi:DNA-binding beta-propeller fold protein YncE
MKRKVFLLMTFALASLLVNAQNIYTIAGNGTAAWKGDNGPAINAEINTPQEVAVDDSGNVYIADFLNSRIRKITLYTGLIQTIAGNGVWGYAGDGVPATKTCLRGPVGVCIDKQRNIYIADQANNRIRKVDNLTGLIHTVAGNGNFGFKGDGGLATAAEFPISIMKRYGR